jgi:response regulator RpfG family c-di-GMP phosphodiesterase
MHEANGKTILLVDDCPANRRLCQKLLEREGFVTAEAVDGKEAVEMAPTLQPHAIIMDIMMPVMDGLEATRLIRQMPDTANIPIIIVSAKTDNEALDAGLAAGADEYIFKPIRAREFLLRVRSMVRLRQTQTEIEQANDSLKRQTQLLKQLNDFSERVLGEKDSDRVFTEIVRTASEMMQSERVSLLIPDRQGDMLQFAHAVGIHDQQWQATRVPMGASVAGSVFLNQEERIVDQPASQDNPKPPYESVYYASMPLICTPLGANGGCLGVLNVTDKHDRSQYDVEDLEALRQFSRIAAMALNNVLTRQQLDETRDSVIFSMAKLSEYRHQETGKHLERVRELCALLANHLADDPRVPEEIDPQFIIDLRRAAPLHDLGKVAIPDNILLKPAKLTDDEFELIKNHTSIGAQTLQSVVAKGHEAGFLQMAMDVAHYHHERWDGNGYPEGLAGNHIPLAARIVCLCDTYDAIRMKRDYKPARPHADAREEIITASGKQFDPLLVEAFCALEDEFLATYEKYAEEETQADGGDEASLSQVEVKELAG